MTSSATLHSSRLRAAALLLAAITGVPACGLAQGTARPDSTSATLASARQEPFFTRGDAWLAAGFAGATLALLPLDRHIATSLQNPDLQRRRLVHHVASDAELLAIPGIYVIGAGAWATGRLAHMPWLASAAVRTGEAVFAGTVAAEAIKGIAGRARPYAVADTSPFDFALGRGITGGEDFASFPSVHSVTAFAAASVITVETARRSPEAVWYVGSLTYGGATLVGLSRMYHDQHWASDVAVAAAIGTFSGLKVELWNRNHPDNWIDRLFLDSSISASRGETRIGWTVSTP